MSDKQIGGDHYAKHKIQPWDIIDEYGLNYYEGNIIKYVLRHRDKNGLQDLQKAMHYLEKLIADTGEIVDSSMTRAMEGDDFPAMKTIKGPAYCADMAVNLSTGKVSRMHTLPNGMEIDLDGGWIPWGGGDCPVRATVRVQCIYRDKELTSIRVADWWYWGHDDVDGDILAYKVVT